MEFAGKADTRKDLLGLRYMAEALAKPNQSLPVVALHASIKGGQVSSDDRREASDRDALQAYHQRILELQVEIAEAESFHDLGHQERLNEELASVIEEVARAKGLGGRLRFDSDSERIRKSVTNAISRALGSIAVVHAELAAHLETYLSRGSALLCAPASPIRWVT